MRIAGDDAVDAVIGEQNVVAPLSTGVAEERAEMRGANLSAAGQTTALEATVDERAAMVHYAVASSLSARNWLCSCCRQSRVAVTGSPMTMEDEGES